VTPFQRAKALAVFLMVQNDSIGKKIRMKRNKSNMHSRIAPLIFPLDKN